MAVTIYTPDGAIATATLEPAARPDSLQDVRVAILDNSKANARHILGQLAAELASDAGTVTAFSWRKPTASRPCPEEILDRIQAEADVALTGTADCGSCTTWSVQDAVALERRGVPTVLVTSEVFEPLARSVATSLGLGELCLGLTGHPIGGLSVDEVTAKAHDLVGSAVAHLTSPATNTGSASG